MKGFLTSTRESHEAKLLTTTNGYYETYTAVQNKSVKTWPVYLIHGASQLGGAPRCQNTNGLSPFVFVHVRM